MSFAAFAAAWFYPAMFATHYASNYFYRNGSPFGSRSQGERIRGFFAVAILIFGVAAMVYRSSTLREFFSDWYIPNRLFDSPPTTIESYEQSLSIWSQLFGTLTIGEVREWHLRTFATAIANRPGRKGGKASANTVRRHLRHVQAVLDAIGPTKRRNAPCAELVDSVPWVRPPREMFRDPLPAIAGDVWATYDAADAATLPKLEGIAAGDWWRAVLSLCLSTALRRSQLFRLEASSVDFSESRLHVPAEVSRKSRRDSWLPIAPIAVRDLLVIRGERDLLFPQPHAWTAIYDQLHLIQATAGVPASRRFGFHAMRRLVLTELAAANGVAATKLAGHRNVSTTANHYAASTVLRDAINALSIWRAAE